MVNVPRDSFMQQYSDMSIYIMMIMPANYDIEVHLVAKIAFLRLQQQHQINVYN